MGGMQQTRFIFIDLIFDIAVETALSRSKLHDIAQTQVRIKDINELAGESYTTVFGMGDDERTTLHDEGVGCCYRLLAGFFQGSVEQCKVCFLNNGCIRKLRR